MVTGKLGTYEDAVDEILNFAIKNEYPNTKERAKFHLEQVHLAFLIDARLDELERLRCVHVGDLGAYLAKRKDEIEAMGRDM